MRGASIPVLERAGTLDGPWPEHTEELMRVSQRDGLVTLSPTKISR